ncbi:unnamed protein product [Pieris macdunnoughi]|uniref:Uncharacterized protein n=1 Tax=Pieris macdunnoughi TaxID=345717 RepID=A0A821PN82_9NEOP|nr:unnamed protein product [Pieris macdunnoughi]
MYACYSACILFLTKLLQVMCCTCSDHDVTVTESGRQIHKGIEDATETATRRNKKRCCPYNFDSKFCKVIGDRLLCGYNTNVGTPRNSEKIVNLNNGCIIRGGRLECGYFEPPYINSRRPPGWDQGSVYENQDIDLENDVDTSMSSPLLKNKLNLKRTTNNLLGSTSCLEIRDRIVCRRF